MFGLLNLFVLHQQHLPVQQSVFEPMSGRDGGGQRQLVFGVSVDLQDLHLHIFLRQLLHQHLPLQRHLHLHLSLSHLPQRHHPHLPDLPTSLSDLPQQLLLPDLLRYHQISGQRGLHQLHLPLQQLLGQCYQLHQLHHHHIDALHLQLQLFSHLSQRLLLRFCGL